MRPRRERFRDSWTGRGVEHGGRQQEPVLAAVYLHHDAAPRDGAGGGERRCGVGAGAFAARGRHDGSRLLAGVDGGA